MRALAWTLPLALLAALPHSAHAHKPSDSYLTLTAHHGGTVDAAWHIALRDLDTELHLDANDDGRLSWGEVRTRWADITQFALPHLRLTQQGQACQALAPTAETPAAPPALIAHTDGQYAVLRWRLQCPVAAGAPWASTELDYRLFALSDPTHRGIVRWLSQPTASDTATPGGTVVLGAPRPKHTLNWSGLGGPLAPPVDAASAGATPGALAAPAAPASPAQAAATTPSAWAWPSMWRFIQDGMHHIGQGTDHILFLVSLLLVSVWQRPGRPKAWPPMSGWLPRERWATALPEVLRLVTAFTVAHSITLALAAFGVLSPPSQWVESLIALSVLLAALDNLFPLLHAPRWVVVFGFGLVHGFGFAGALQDLGLAHSELAAPLLGFNLGVELGQLALVALTLPPACVLRKTRLYRWLHVGGGSLFIAAMALVWLIERVMNVTILGWGG